MSKLTIKEYAILNKVSVQSVYKKIKDQKLEAQTLNNIKYIIIKDEIDYEKRFNELQVEYNYLKEKNESQKELINILKEDRKLFSNLIEYRKEVEQPLTKKEKKSKKKKKKNK